MKNVTSKNSNDTQYWFCVAAEESCDVMCVGKGRIEDVCGLAGNTDRCDEKVFYFLQYVIPEYTIKSNKNLYDLICETEDECGVYYTVGNELLSMAQSGDFTFLNMEEE